MSQRTQCGNIALMTALLFLPVAALLGGAVDLIRFTQVRSELQHALDAAALSASSLTNEREMDAVIHDYLSANLDTALIAPNRFDLTIATENDATGKRVSIAASTTLQTAFLKLIGFDEFDVSVTTGGRQDWQGVEIALVLDVSGSMATNNKIGRLKTAAKDFVDTVLDEDVEDITSVTIVPFGTHVNVGAPFLPWVPANRIDLFRDNNPLDGSRWLGCLDIPANYYTGLPFPRRNLDPLPEFLDDNLRLCPTADNAAYYQDNDRARLKSKIDRLHAESALAAGTSIDEGAQIGLVSLSPEMRGSFPGPFAGTRPAGYDADILKVLVIMSDGDMMKLYRPTRCAFLVSFCVTWPISDTEAEDNLVAMCTDAADKGILVYTVGFGIEAGSRADRVLSDCAQTEATYLRVEDDGIDEAFRAIAASINRVRLVQ